MKKVITGLCLLLCGIGISVADDMATYRVTITNGTLHQVITPPLIVSHRQHFKLFQVGQPASESLATLAETGNNQPLMNDVEASRGVYDVVAGSAPVLPGQSASFDVRASKKGLISLAAMLATTNDGFIALHSVALPRRSGEYAAYVYDAGSETNNESCAYVPGPPCAADSGNASDDGEGYVSFHNGIHGGGDLNAKHLDWRGPAALVSIKRIGE